jgi:hypothetical protein
MVFLIQTLTENFIVERFGGMSGRLLLHDTRGLSTENKKRGRTNRAWSRG